MNRQFLCIMILALPVLIHAQGDSINKGINWTTGLSWEQIKQKAKAENKYIFLDCFATWCGPCKLMDKNVYTADPVADFFNEKFISVKVQMDKTANDEEGTKKWYTDADSINKQYHVEGYPTFLFFNPNGQVTEKELGYKPVNEFVALSKSATTPGKLYDDPYVDYKIKLAAYEQGQRNYDDYISMIKTAEKFRDTVISKQLIKEFNDYAAGLPPKDRYTKERIEFWNNYIWLSGTRVFDFFYKDSKLINKVMNKKSYAENFIDKAIQYEIVSPFLRNQANGSGIAMDGMYMSGPGLKADYSEADWDKLEKLIDGKYGKVCACRNVLMGRVEWYNRHRNKGAAIKYSLELFNRYPLDISEKATPSKINGPAWDAFLTMNDKSVLKGYVKWMESVVKVWHQDNYADTYANLLYKLGHRKKAIKWEKKALQFSPKDQSLIATLQHMQKGEPTYLDQGALWEN